MPDPLLVVLVVVGLCAPAWLARDLRSLHPRPAGEPRDRSLVSVSVVVPARDEADSLPRVLRALRELRHPVLEVVVVDDGSRDATADVARAQGAEVVEAGDLPAGWTGKAWACHVGARVTHGEVLVFLDADTVLGPDALDGLLALRAEHGGLISVEPFHVAVRPFEQLSAYPNAVSVLGSGAFRCDPRGRPMAFGPCLVTSRADLERAGGHAAVRGAVLDDVRLAQAYADARLPVRCCVGGASVRMRSYPGGLRDLVAGWSKNMAAGAGATRVGPGLATTAWVAAHHAVAVGTLGSLVALATGPDPVWVTATWVAAWLLVAAQLHRLLSVLGTFRWWTSAFFPLPLLFLDLVLLRSLVRTVGTRSVTWRGREVRVGC